MAGNIPFAIPYISSGLVCLALGLIATGIVISFIGFVLSGANPRVFSANIDRGTAVLGGVKATNVEDIPLLASICELGSIEYNVSESPEGPDAKN